MFTRIQHQKKFRGFSFAEETFPVRGSKRIDGFSPTLLPSNRCRPIPRDTSALLAVILPDQSYLVYCKKLGPPSFKEMHDGLSWGEKCDSRHCFCRMDYKVLLRRHVSHGSIRYERAPSDQLGSFKCWKASEQLGGLTTPKNQPPLCKR